MKYYFSRRNVLLFLVIIGVATFSQLRNDVSESELSISVSETNTDNVKLILIWTLCYGVDNGLYFGFGRDKFSQCPVSNCETIKDRSLFNQSQAVMFLVLPGDFNFDDLPTHRFAHQRFVMYHMEPPTQTSRPQFNDVDRHFFNWTFTYRRTADISSNSYGDYVFKNDSLARKIEGSYDREESLDNFYGVNITSKSIMAAWFTSHCDTTGGREHLYHELRKYIRIDVYGKCGKFQCPKKVHHESDDCNAMLRKKYFFYFSFENSLCPEYVTEKLFRALRSGVVPVVFGGAHYSKFAPPHSYINAQDFTSPKALAQYLITVSSNPKLYSHFFEWRRHFDVRSPKIDPWCQLCQMLNDQSLPAKTYENISRWWFEEMPCQDFHWKDPTNKTTPRTFLSPLLQDPFYRK